MDQSPPRESGPFSVTAIGWVVSPYHRRFGTPHQATAVDSDQPAILRMDAERFPPVAFADLHGFDHIWIVSWLHRGGTWAPMVRPPRGTRERRGLFATRSPDRPNPIGLSAARLVKIDGCDLHVRGIDLLDGTPILDVKPYLPYVDAFPESKAGWVDAISPTAPQVAKRPPKK